MSHSTSERLADGQQTFLRRLHDQLQGQQLDDLGDITWSDAQFVRACLLRCERGDLSGWKEFLSRLRSHAPFAIFILGWGEESDFFSREIRDDGSEQFVVEDPRTTPAWDAALREVVDAMRLTLRDAAPLSGPTKRAAQELRYIELKGGLAGGLSGPARIGWVQLSRTGKTLYYRGHSFQSLKGYGYKANYFNTTTNTWYWISGCRRDGNDRLYSGTVEIDSDAREEYWRVIRKRPDLVHQSRFRSRGKY